MTLISVIDTETTGLGKFDKRGLREQDYPISIGIVVADVDESSKTIKCLDGMYSLIKIPNPSLAERTMLIHHILPEDVEGAPSPKLVCKNVLELYKRHGLIPVCAWNYPVDKYFMEIMFKMARVESPDLKWVEMKPESRACLDTYVNSFVHEKEVLNLEAHNAYNDCIRTLSVYAALNGFTLDISEVNCC
jgi:DNA polymerase III epsilon subunit-like protein